TSPAACASSTWPRWRSSARSSCTASATPRAPTGSPVMPSARPPSRERSELAAGRRLSVQRGLLLRGGERPCSARAALLAEHETQLLRRLQLSLVGTKRRAGLRQIERAQQVAAEVAFLAADFPWRTFALLSRRQFQSPGDELDGRNSGHQSTLSGDRVPATRKTQRKTFR